MKNHSDNGGIMKEAARTLPVYQMIALDLAARIVQGEFPEGERFSGRTLLAGQYSVSPETVRKAVVMLKDAGIVEVSQGKEVRVRAVAAAARFLAKQEEASSVYALREELEDLQAKREEIDARFREVVNELIQYSSGIKSIQPYNPEEIFIPDGSPAVGENLITLRFRIISGALVIAVRRDTKVIIAPDPKLPLQGGDRLVLLGSAEKIKAARELIAHGVPKDK